MWCLLRQRLEHNIQDVIETLREMALDARLMPLSPSPAPEARPAAYPSSASTPSLRSRDGTVPMLSRMDGGGNVRVVVRVREFLQRELDRNAQCLVDMDPITQVTTLRKPEPPPDVSAARTPMSRRNAADKSFTFDNSFWSHDRRDRHYATQEIVYNSLGEEFLDHNFEGYHTCIFAYGQTGSGKSYTMMGTPDNPGLIPRTCEDLFERIDAAQNEDSSFAFHVRVSYFEVYNEHVRDLLVPVAPGGAPNYLKIRESPTDGPYIRDLTEVPVWSLGEILRYMKMGDASRTVASTKMNDTSSRSHAVFTIMLKQIHHDLETDETTERSSRIRLVDLAGSERAKATEATGVRLREGSNINKSLTTLGRVIAALADPKQLRSGKRKDVVPYRDSILTWLLKDSLGGNSKTAMIACVAPSDYDETLSTLRYADQAKRIRTRAVINQDFISTAERDAQIAAMAEEIRILQLSVSDSRQREKNAKEAEDKLEEYQARVVTMQRMMEERSMVAESKIKKLQTENEALKLHLKLAIESLKNPIPPVNQAHDDDHDDEDDEDEDEDEDGYDYDSESTAAAEEEEQDLQEEMEQYVKDMANLRKLIAGDVSRFRDPDGLRQPLGARREDAESSMMTLD
ncbi:Kinesin-like protein KIF1C [Escovopsis weberi]|uniref:Kinesin-like protein n=1 Tax=Escovopsis weberi TaxID=150374 RepID=A0A0M8MU49_ESCWE|nr:Kinesin-like protein KIF1C [Escovopsis weberi]